MLPGTGDDVGAILLEQSGVAGVAFTGSTHTARRIAVTLAARDGPIVPLIAETGGQNAMIVDSTALVEQVTDDVIASAFGSAGQRCSALRILCVQEEVSETVIDSVCGAMDQLSIGDPALLATDVGPVIDDEARARLLTHIDEWTNASRLIHRVDAPPSAQGGCFVSPHLLDLHSIGELDDEHFGPVLHVIAWPADALEDTLAAIRATGFGLTLGIHTRMDDRVRHIVEQMPVGNVYVNRNTVGAMVGTQPFGGEGLSGTGPKAGGPRYLDRFATERTLSVNLMATGGDVELLRG